MMTLRLALRNLSRNRKRSILTGVALALGVAILVFALGVNQGIEQQGLDSVIRFQTAHVKAIPPGRMDEDFPGLDMRIDNASSLLEEVRNMDGVEGAAERLEIRGMLYMGTEEVFVTVVGINPEEDRQVYSTLDYVVQGRELRPGEQGVLIGRPLAKSLDVDVGDRVTIMIRSAPGALNPRTLPVVGLHSTGHFESDMSSVFLPLQTALDMAILDDAATEVSLRLDQPDRSRDVKEMLSKRHPGVEWHTYLDLASDFVMMIKFQRIVYLIIIGILMVMAAVGVANTMLMAVHERTREIGALRALGFQTGTVRAMFLNEGILLGVFAGLAGLAIGIPLTLYFSHHGISLGEATELANMKGVPVRDAIYPAVKAGTIGWIYLFGLAVSALASWGASARASKGEIVRALREGMI
ncbi:FtsX-like permease family protein [bacterium]|nr:FtsX-like permease family protein [bacterium]